MYAGLIVKDMSESKTLGNRKQSLLVVGYGWGADALLERIDLQKYDIRVVSPRTSRLDQPHMIAALSRRCLAAPHTVGYDEVIHQDMCEKIDKERRLVLSDRSAYKYDVLVVATGSEPNDFRIPGVRDHCRMFKSEEDFHALRSAISTKKSAIIMGAGPTGIELACKLQSMGLAVSIVEAAEQILPGFSENMKQKTGYVLADNNIHVYTHHPITEITKDAIVTKKGPLTYSPSTDLLVWTCGIQPVAFVRNETGGRPFVTDGHLKVVGSENIYAIGDSVSGRGPPTAQNAVQQGAFLASYLNGTTAQEYSYKEKGRILDLTYGDLVEVAGFSFYLPRDFYLYLDC
jgi:NADH dehydrogenase